MQKLKLLAYCIGWLFMSLMPLSAQQHYGVYTIDFEAGEDALPSLSTLDSLKAFAGLALSSDSSTIIIERYVDYWMRSDDYYTLLRKRSFLLQQIFEREGLGAEHLVIETRALEEPDSAKALRHRIRILLTSTSHQPLKKERVPVAINYYAEVKNLLWKLCAEQQQRFRIQPAKDTVLYTSQGAMLVIPANSFAVDPRARYIDLEWTEAYRKSAILPFQLTSPQAQDQMRTWGAVWNIEASYAGRRLNLRNTAELLVFLPTDNGYTDLRLFHSPSSDTASFKWKKQEMGAWKPIHPLCLVLADANKDSFQYYCNYPMPTKPSPAAAPQKPQKPIYEKLDSLRLFELDSLIKLHEGVIKDIKDSYRKKEDKRWVGKKKKKKNEQQYQRELEAALRHKRKVQRERKAMIQKVKESNGKLKQAYQLKYHAYARELDSLQQEYLAAISRWKQSRDSLQWLCAYERQAIHYLSGKYTYAKLKKWHKDLDKTVNLTLAPAAEQLFEPARQHFIFPIKKMGWSALQKAEPAHKKSMEYKAFTFGPELPSYKIVGSTLLQNAPTMVASTALDMDNIAFAPLPAEAKIWLLAMYVDGEKAYVDLQKARVNKLPYKLDFQPVSDLNALKELLKRLDE